MDSWFFLKYADPDYHVRWRLHVTDTARVPAVAAACQQVLANDPSHDRSWRVQLDTYEREVERYGGLAGVLLAESLYHADSDAAVRVIGSIRSGPPELRWQSLLYGLHQLLIDFGFDRDERHGMVRTMRQAYAREFDASRSSVRKKLAAKYRAERQAVAALLSASPERVLPGSTITAFRERSARIVPLMSRLRTQRVRPRPALSIADLAPSYLHLSATRYLQSTVRLQELVMYDFLDRWYEGEIARHTSHGADQRRSVSSDGAPSESDSALVPD